MFDIKRIKLIASREIQATLGKRSYRAGLIVQILIVALLALSPIIIAKFRGDDSGGPTVNTIVVVDQANANLSVLLPPMLDALSNDADRRFEISEVADDTAARDAVERGDADAALIATRPNDELAFTVITDDGDIQNSLAQMLVATASSIAIQERIDATGLSASEVQQLFTPPTMTTVQADPTASEDEGNGTEDIVNFIIAYASTIIIFIFVVMYGQWISQGVVEEKASRIMEIMVNAATPRDLLAGKVIGIMMTALMQFVPLVLTFGIIASLQVQIGKLVGVSEDQLLD
ncbi:MAG: ABC transporter permease, partial [Thermomicrobiales bacterium]|nr:ABC transporter permease [Thermomicrobiales bacterium]